MYGYCKQSWCCHKVFRRTHSMYICVILSGFHSLWIGELYFRFPLCSHTHVNVFMNVPFVVPTRMYMYVYVHLYYVCCQNNGTLVLKNCQMIDRPFNHTHIDWMWFLFKHFSLFVHIQRCSVAIALAVVVFVVVFPHEIYFCMRVTALLHFECVRACSVYKLYTHIYIIQYNWTRVLVINRPLIMTHWLSNTTERRLKIFFQTLY